MNLLISGAVIGGIVGGVVGLLLLVIVIWLIATRNKFVSLNNQCEEAFKNIDVFLKKRYDLIPNIVETVKGYAKHESQTLESVIAARNAVGAADTAEKKIAADKNLSAALRSMNIVVERYPELKANAGFLDLQSQLKSIEGELSNARRYYNATVKVYNTKREYFPSSIIASWMHLTKKEYFELESEEERRNVKVSF